MKMENIWFHPIISSSCSWLIFTNQKLLIIYHSTSVDAIISKYLPVKNLTFDSLVPYHILIKDAVNLKSKFIIIGIFAVLLALIASLILSSKICRNLQLLTKSMEDIKAGNLDARARIGYYPQFWTASVHG